MRHRVSTIPWLVLGLALSATAVATLYVNHVVRMKDRERFENSVQQVHDNIRDRINTYVAMLRGTRGLFAVGQRVLTDDFRKYVQRLELDRHWPGVQGIGFSRYVPAGSKRTNLMNESMDQNLTTRVNGFDEPFRIWPDAERDEYHPIIYLEPLNDANHAAIGYDMFTDPVRREAMERARDTGEPTASGRVRLVQDKADASAGAEGSFLLFVPVYVEGVTPPTVEQRRQQLRGFVYSPFRTGDLLAGIFGTERHPRLSFTIHDGSTPTPDHLLFDGEAEASAQAYRPRFSTEVPVEVAGRTWTMRCATRPGFELASTRPLVPLVPIAGGLVSLGLFFLAREQARARGRAEDTAVALRESEARLRRLVDSNVVGVAYADTGGGISDANQAFADLVGYGVHEIRAGTVRWDALTPPEYAAADRQAVAQLAATGMCKPFEKEFIRKDGSRVPVLVGIAAMEGASAQAIGLVVDLTERKRAERDRAELLAREQEARREAERANRLKDEFLATVSHELRTPLNAILGWTHLLRARGGADPALTAEAITVIDRNSRMQVQLIDDLLDVSRIVSGKLRVNARPTRLVETVEAAVQSARPAIDAKQITLVTNYDAGRSIVWADPDRIQQVAWNLLSNAIKFTPRGGLVEVTLGERDSHVELVVRDTGQGIKREFLPHAFSAFRQGDATPTRRHGGLGLGLAIVRHLVELHGGTVEAHSEGEGRGATFKVVLPLHGAREAIHAAPQAGQPASIETMSERARG